MLSNKSVNETIALVEQAYSATGGSAKIKDALQEYYTYGHCMDLAIAFHRLYGFEIEATIVDDKAGSWIGHAWVKMDDGLYLDVMGTYVDRFELESFGGKTLSNLKEVDLLEYINDAHKPIPNIDIEKAIVVAEKLRKYLP